MLSEKNGYLRSGKVGFADNRSHDKMMENKKKKVVIAIDSFKGCLTSAEANAAASRAFDDKEYDVSTFSVSDGGDGMLDAFANAWNAKTVEVPTHDALMRHRTGDIAIAGDTAIIEVAQSVGLSFIEPEQRNPLVATSYGVGELIAEALHRCCKHLIIGLGGTATSDCGIGMLHALIDRMTHSGNIDDLKLDGVDVTLATDVGNPLLGSDGAASVFGPQKGASPEMVFQLEHRAETFSRLSAKHCGRDESKTAGAGAAGGLGYAFLQFFDARIISGADLLFSQLNFDKKLEGCDLVITGEGSADRQTLMGKLPQKVLEHASKSADNPVVWLIAGKTEDEDELREAGFTRVININEFLKDGEDPMDKDIARRNIEQSVASRIRFERF